MNSKYTRAIVGFSVPTVFLTALHNIKMRDCQSIKNLYYYCYYPGSKKIKVTLEPHEYFE